MIATEKAAAQREMINAKGDDAKSKAVVVQTSEYIVQLSLLLKGKIAALVPVYNKMAIKNTTLTFAFGDCLSFNKKCFAIIGFTIKDNDVIVHFLVHDGSSSKKSPYYDETASVTKLVDLLQQSKTIRYSLTSPECVICQNAMKKKIKTYTYNPKSSSRQGGVRNNYVTATESVDNTTSISSESAAVQSDNAKATYKATIKVTKSVTKNRNKCTTKIGKKPAKVEKAKKITKGTSVITKGPPVPAAKSSSSAPIVINFANPTPTSSQTAAPALSAAPIIPTPATTHPQPHETLQFQSAIAEMEQRKEREKLRMDEEKAVASHKRFLEMEKIRENASAREHERTVAMVSLSTEAALKAVALMKSDGGTTTRSRASCGSDSETELVNNPSKRQRIASAPAPAVVMSSSQLSIPDAMAKLKEFLVDVCYIDMHTLALPQTVLSKASEMLLVSTDTELASRLREKRALVDKLNCIIDAIFNATCDMLPPLPVVMTKLRDFLQQHCSYPLEDLHSPQELITSMMDVLGGNEDVLLTNRMQQIESVRGKINALVQEGRL
jgi:hypothetical protein